MTPAIHPSMDVFENVCADPLASARAAAAQGRKIAGLLCTYVPRELFHAAGYLPVRIALRQGGTPLADGLLQSYSCSFARGVLDRALSGDLDFIHLAVFAHTCDTMQNLADLWRSNRPDQAVIIVSTPALTAGDAARAYFRREMDRVRAALETLSGPVSDAALSKSLQLHEAHRAAMRRLYAFRRAHPEHFSGRDAHTVAMAATAMPIEEHLELLEALLVGLENEVDAASLPRSKRLEASSTFPARPRVLLAGAMCQDRGFIEAVEATGCLVVDDDLCSGSRAFDWPPAPPGEPMDVLTRLYLGRTPCPAFYRPGFDPGAHLLDRARAAKAEGVVFLLTKFCDPWAFDYPHLAKTLETEGIPMLLLEVEQNAPASGQMRTRAEAFAEMMQSRTG